jgi:hypothetical protein
VRGGDVGEARLAAAVRAVVVRVVPLLDELQRHCAHTKQEATAQVELSMS